jgi:hypothetical protein
MSRERRQNTRSARQLYPLILAVLIYATPPRRGSAEEMVDFKVMHYQESGGRIGVTSPAFRYHYDVSPTFGIRIDGIFNTISGASPTGAPPVPVTTTVTQVVPTAGGGSTTPATGGDDDDDDDDDDDEIEDRALRRGRYHTRAAATPTTTSSGSGSSGGGTTTVTTQVPTGAVDVPMGQVEDERWGLNLELVKKIENHALSTKVSFSSESDYESYALALSDGIEFNNRNTIAALGAAYTHDTIDVFATGGTDTKTTVDFMLGLTQLLDKKTRLQANLMLGRVSGYMNDPYKVAELNGVLVSESRPDDKTKTTFYFALIRYIETLQASIDGSYRYYNDDFGVTGHTVSLAWYQELGDHFILRPRVRWYRQTAADFYAVRFTGSPEFYSSDYRLSELETLSYGAKVIWRPSDRFALDVGYDRYEQQGKDGVTNDMMYPSADIVTGGFRVWF